MTLPKLLYALATLCAATVASAANHVTVADLTFTCNQHGAVVQTPESETFYLGNSCDAAQPGVGEGHWWFAASGFAIEINGQARIFYGDLQCEMPYCLPQ